MYNKYFRHFSFFYNYLHHRIFVNMGLNVAVGLLDGFGIVMFLPLLKMVDGSSQVSSEELSSLGFVIQGIEGMGLSLNLKTVLLFMLFFFTLKGIARFFESYYRTSVQYFFVKNLRMEGIYSLKDYSYKHFVNSDSGKIQNTLSGEINRVAAASSSYFMALQCAVMATVYGILAFMANAQFAIMVMVGGLISNQLFKVINRKTLEASRKITWEGHEYQGLLIQKVGFFKYLKATALIDAYTEKMTKLVERIETNGKKIGFYGTILYASKEPVIMAVVISVIFIQTSVMSQSLGLIILSLLFFYRALTYLMSLQTFYNGFLTNSGALENMREFLDELKANAEPTQNGEQVRLNREIRLTDLSFAYGERTILKNISLEIPKNQSIAFVGESGSGKTTLVNILSGLIPKQKGKFEIDNISIDSIDLKYYQSKIGYITQEPVIFSDSVFNNVTFWAEKSEDIIRRFWASLERAHIADFIRQLPEGENTLLGTNGILVSGGQKQRISIARELFKDIDILIMDEATSALDSESEKSIQENIDQLRGTITLIIVAHRLATIKNVDRIVLLSEGKIIGSDGFGELLEHSAVFKRMVDLQTF
ncbi:ABC transporter ATP-binding protein [Algoriphagus aestuariicola]|uniref:ABC transporter ATP-binding protein n=1 Tax=Algoriphagus aestuariicola TaxID=1852016 RepID=A0ABS3BMM8_9BACT|nr:ABC transporter ATP-binding protein [Algoriphagus aestuariicola]MBN7800176.1 ABC transporter ATP-binding protein [Algoriphagus aestuariicola]